MSDSSQSADASGKHSRQRSLRERISAAWAKTGITWRTYKMMFKGALAPTICLALYQADSFANFFSNIGYLIAIVSILSVVFRPRATYLQSLLLNLVTVCATAAVATLALFTIVMARENNPEPRTDDNATAGVAAAGLSTSPYNSSASAVAGVWLFFLVYALATLRASGTQYKIAATMGSILANVSMVYAAQLADMTTGLAYIRTFLSAFLVGMAIATAVSLLIFPVTNRTVIFEDATKYIAAVRSALNANITYITSLEHEDMFTMKRTETTRRQPQRSQEVQAVKSAIRGLSGIAGKFQQDLAFAKREIAVGYLGPDDLQDLSRHLRMVYVPMVGLSCLSDMFERAAKTRGWESDETLTPEAHELKLRSIGQWHELIRLIKGPFQSMTDVIDRGLEHVLVQLRLAPAVDNVNVEDKPTVLHPGHASFLQRFTAQTKALHDQRTNMLVGLCKLHGVELAADYFTNPPSQDEQLQELMHVKPGSTEAKTMRRQLYLLLYMEFLLWSVGRRTEDFIIYVNRLKTSGKLDKRRLVVPGWKRMRKWLRSTFSAEDNEQEEHNVEDTLGPSVTLGQAFQRKKDPTHLPPTNTREHLGEYVRKIPELLRSPPSAFGFRVACATLSIAVIAFLESTQPIYTGERLFWAQIMISIGMQPTASDSLRTSFFRIVGTAVFMVVALVNWYIPVGIPGGIIPIYFVVLHLGPWIIIKYPQYTTLGMIGPITVTLIVGYELQTLKIGEQAAQSSGQLYYPVYILGPIRLATVLGGLVVGWIWTIFPFPVTEHQQQKHGLGRTLYHMAHYYSVMHETVLLRLRGLDTDSDVFMSINGMLGKARRAIYMKCTALLAGLRTRTDMMQFDIPIGGKFPRKQYEDITEILQSMLNFMVLITYASTTFNDLKDAQEAQSLQSEWLDAFRQLVAQTNQTSHNVATLLSLLASSVSNSEPLPPYLKNPEPYQMSEQLDKLDGDILSVRHVIEPGYSSFAVTQLALRSLHDDLEVLVPAVKELVGELDFSLNIDRSSKGLNEKMKHAD